MKLVEATLYHRLCQHKFRHKADSEIFGGGFKLTCPGCGRKGDDHDFIVLSALTIGEKP